MTIRLPRAWAIAALASMAWLAVIDAGLLLSQLAQLAT